MDTDSKAKKYLIGRKVDRFFIKVHKASSFTIRYFKELVTSPHEVGEFVQQCYNIGYRSLSLITLTSFITGYVFTKQSRPSLSEFGATSWIPSLVGIAMIRALAPLVTALICAGKVGSSIGAEIGSMKVTEQIDAMEVSAVNPYKYLIVTRVTASTLMIPVLMMYAGFVGLMGSFLNVSQNELTTLTAFFHNAFEKITMLDIVSSVIRSLAYGFTIGIVGCYKGYNTSQGTQGVGKAANAAVVASMFLIFIEEVILVQVINWFR
ncbi:MlaE family ABC transporter permease [Desertivirga xinjiangensis]|uniref:MlaE family ABC transporter permease n=1 Tax=Desertivirga xinjiangensis TaxID=539206 RepID=UPI00210E43DA|nr:ABC transporter permease [Pedobacter xinjiangensis]